MINCRLPRSTRLPIPLLRHHITSTPSTSSTVSGTHQVHLQKLYSVPPATAHTVRASYSASSGVFPAFFGRTSLYIVFFCVFLRFIVFCIDCIFQLFSFSNFSAFPNFNFFSINFFPLCNRPPSKPTTSPHSSKGDSECRPR